LCADERKVDISFAVDRIGVGQRFDIINKDVCRIADAKTVLLCVNCECVFRNFREVLRVKLAIC